MYCTVADVKGELYLPLVTQMERQFGEELPSFLEGHIRRADDYIDARLSRSFTVPFDKPPTVVVTISAKLAAYFATAQFSETEELSEDKYKAAKEMLTDLQTSGVLPGEQEEAPRGLIRGGGAEQVFTDAAMSDW